MGKNDAPFPAEEFQNASQVEEGLSDSDLEKVVGGDLRKRVELGWSYGEYLRQENRAAGKTPEQLMQGYQEMMKRVGFPVPDKFAREWLKDFQAGR